MPLCLIIACSTVINAQTHLPLIVCGRCQSGGTPVNRQVLLVADDNEDNRLVFATILRHNNYDVIEAIDGSTAVEAAKQHRPDLILLDLRMPGLTGWETI